jgi:diaminopimelate epimerase
LRNGFLTFFDETEEQPFSAEIAEFLCDRHFGLGADGLIRMSRAQNGQKFKMTLRNADGTLAETSGNGLRCAALAVFVQGMEKTDTYNGEISGATEIEAADITVEAFCRFLSVDDITSAEVEVSMGEVKITQVKSPVEGTTAFEANVGNPHLVICGNGFHGLDLAAIGAGEEKARPQGINVEFLDISNLAAFPKAVFPMVVWERGVGFTKACGSGSVASAAAIGETLLGQNSQLSENFTYVIANPGGDLQVRLEPFTKSSYFTYLRGPANYIATADVLLPQRFIKNTVHG